jgi:hypothetical protein
MTVILNSAKVILKFQLSLLIDYLCQYILSGKTPCSQLHYFTCFTLGIATKCYPSVAIIKIIKMVKPNHGVVTVAIC